MLTVGLLPLDGGAFQARVRIEPFTSEASVQIVAREMLQSDNGFGISFERKFYRLDEAIVTMESYRHGEAWAGGTFAPDLAAPAATESDDSKIGLILIIVAVILIGLIAGFLITSRGRTTETHVYTGPTKPAGMQAGEKPVILSAMAMQATTPMRRGLPISPGAGWGDSDYHAPPSPLLQRNRIGTPMQPMSPTPLTGTPRGNGPAFGGPPMPDRSRGGSGNRWPLRSKMGTGLGDPPAGQTPALSPVLASGAGPLSHRTTASKINPVFAIGNFYIGGTYDNDNEVEEV